MIPDAYVFRLTASDGTLSTSDTVTFTLTGVAIAGDVDGDLQVDADALLLVRGDFARVGTAIITPGADQNGDGRVDAVDVERVLRALP